MREAGEGVVPDQRELVGVEQAAKRGGWRQHQGTRDTGGHQDARPAAWGTYRNCSEGMWAKAASRSSVKAAFTIVLPATRSFRAVRERGGLHHPLPFSDVPAVTRSILTREGCWVGGSAWGSIPSSNAPCWGWQGGDKVLNPTAASGGYPGPLAPPDRVHTHTRTCTCMHKHTYAHACTCTHIHVHICTCMHMHTHTCVHTHVHTCMHTHTHMHTHTYTHMHAHACTCIHIHAPTTHTHARTRLWCPLGHAPGPTSCVPLGLWSPRSRQTGSAVGTGCSPAPSLADGWLRVHGDLPLPQDTGTGPGCPQEPPTLPVPPPPLQHKERGCPSHPRATSILHPGDVTWSLSPRPSRCRGTHSEMISGGRFLGTALESTQKAVSRVQEQLGGQGGGRGGLRPPAGSQNQAKARRRRRRAESWSLGILLPRRSSIPGLALLCPPQLVPLCPGAAAKTFILFFLLLSLFFLPLRFQRGGEAMPEAGGTRGAALRRTMLLCCGEEGGTEGGMRLSDGTSIPGDAGPNRGVQTGVCKQTGGCTLVGSWLLWGCSGLGDRRVPAGAMPPRLCRPVVAAVPPTPAACPPWHRPPVCLLRPVRPVPGTVLPANNEPSQLLPRAGGDTHAAAHAQGCRSQGCSPPVLRGLGADMGGVLFALTPPTPRPKCWERALGCFTPLPQLLSPLSKQHKWHFGSWGGPHPAPPGDL